MSTLTAALFAALIVYLGGWWAGQWVGNFALVLFLLAIVTMAYWLGEKLVWRPQRRRAAEAIVQADRDRRTALAAQGIQKVDGDVSAAHAMALAQPWWVEWTAGLFPVIVAVFLLRSFLYEPFKIPSGSMVPTLLVGDLILVNKFHYGIRLPVVNTKIVPMNDPKRGDVMVFRYPPDPRMDYIKRVVGVPGDTVAYLNQKLTVNGQPVPVQALGEFYDDDALRYAPMFEEKLGDGHRILVDPNRHPQFGGEFATFPNRDACRYSAEGVVCTVPKGHYFMMGDNRDNSQDSRFWGFVPDENIVGKAFMIWMNFSNPGRIGAFR